MYVLKETQHLYLYLIYLNQGAKVMYQEFWSFQLKHLEIASYVWLRNNNGIDEITL